MNRFCHIWVILFALSASLLTACGPASNAAGNTTSQTSAAGGSSGQTEPEGLKGAEARAALWAEMGTEGWARCMSAQVAISALAARGDPMDPAFVQNNGAVGEILGAVRGEMLAGGVPQQVLDGLIRAYSSQIRSGDQAAEVVNDCAGQINLVMSRGAQPQASAANQSSGAEPADPRSGSDVIDTAIAAGSFTTLVAAVQAAGLVETLKGPGPFTVFAPTDAAFAALPAGTVEDLLKPENKAKLTAILTYHVLPAEVMSSAIGATATDVATVEGKTVKVDGSTAGRVMINDATVVAADVEASNGVIHVIDKVLLPPMASSVARSVEIPSALVAPKLPKTATASELPFKVVTLEDGRTYRWTQFTPNQPILITATSVRFRSVPFTDQDSTVIAVGQLGQTLAVDGIVNMPDWSWYRIKLQGGSVGFVRSDLTSSPLKGAL